VLDMQGEIELAPLMQQRRSSAAERNRALLLGRPRTGAALQECYNL
jgi:hypothetical protein